MKFSNVIVKSQMNHNFAFGIEVNSYVIKITIGNTTPCFQIQLVCDKLFTSFIFDWTLFACWGSWQTALLS